LIDKVKNGINSAMQPNVNNMIQTVLSLMHGSDESVTLCVEFEFMTVGSGVTWFTHADAM